jgi:hypothetical protein
MNFNTRIFLFIFIICLGVQTFSSDFKIDAHWEVDIEKVFPKKDISESYSPILSNNKLVFGNKQGIVKTLDINTKEVEKILRVPISIHNSVLFNDEKLSKYVVFYGQHFTNKKFYYCTIDVEKKKIKGIITHDKPFLPFGEFAIFEKYKSFIVFSPREGKGIYTQKTNFGIMNPIFTQDFKRHVFQSTNNEIVDISIPRFGASLIMSPKSTRDDVLTFNNVITIQKNQIADNISSDTLFYHTNSGIIGQINTEKRKIVWERKYFAKNMKLQGPYIYDEHVIYLVSYPKTNKTKNSKGKLISINKKSGQANWISKDLPYKNFGIIHFDKYIMSFDDEGNILFLDLKTGKLLGKVPVVGAVSRPLIYKDKTFIMTSEKVYMIKNTRFLFKLKLFYIKLKDLVT